MFSIKKEKLHSPTLEDSFFPFSSSSASGGRTRTPGCVPEAMAQSENCPAVLEGDLILAAELGQALLERNEELGTQLEQKERDMESLQQEKHVMQRHLDVQAMEAVQREAELQADLSALQEQLEQQRSQSKLQRQKDHHQLTQLSSHNQKLVEQLAEAVASEHALRSELCMLKEDNEDSSFSRCITSARLDSLQAENHVLLERYGNADKQLKSTQEDYERLRVDRDRLKHRVTDLQTCLQDREAELEQEHSAVFQLHSQNHVLQQRVLALGEEASLVDNTNLPLSIQGEIQLSQAKEAIFIHSEVLQKKEEELQVLRDELQNREKEIQLLTDELLPFRSGPGKPSYSLLEEELIRSQQERDSLNQQLLNTIKHKVALSQEVDAWQEDMRLVIRQQVQIQEEEKEREKSAAIQRGKRTSKSMRLRGETEPRDRGFFSSLFGGN
ncbi:BICD family-like cargo adapter 2 isoform X2 [Denticeps clupeoides]|uniref:BICD family-like cargo adapter 2 n=2 Tax=Denticeps clupeoides TaxID=299321 RepID=A0AAY4BWZ0_9TELE|nr:BICD family-like cargo adapter 2 isoform X2 [Denticeps clupeoides]